MVDNASLVKRSDIHLKRRMWHVVSGVFSIALYYYSNVELIYWGVLALIVALLGFFLDFKRLKNPALNEKLSKILTPIMRRSEKLSFSGLPFYALGIALAIFFYQPKIAMLAIMYLVFADPVASIIGVKFGKDRLLPNKTLQGTVAAFGVCLSVSLIYLFCLGVNSPNVIMFVFFGSIIGALSEMLGAFNVDDNLIIPVLSGAALTGLNYWLVVI